MKRMTPEEYREWNRTEGFMPHLVGDAEKCVCRDCKFRLRYNGDKTGKTEEWLKKADINYMLKCVCEKFRREYPEGMHVKPDGVLEGKKGCDLYEKE